MRHRCLIHIYITTRCHDPEDHVMNLRNRENFKSLIYARELNLINSKAGGQVEENADVCLWLLFM
jgi:hypothetical protein